MAPNLMRNWSPISLTKTHAKTLQITGGHDITLQCSYLTCPAGTGFFPLDEQLALSCVLPSSCVHQALVRLASSLPFREASEHLHALLGVQVSASTSQ